MSSGASAFGPVPAAAQEEAPAHRENERKFLVKARYLPRELEKYPSVEILQGYYGKPGEKGEPRVRRITDKTGVRFVRTTKTETGPQIKGAGLERDEKEPDISEKEFYECLAKAGCRVIEKTRYQIPFNGLTIELDIYKGSHEGFRMAEIEFENRAQALAFKEGPTWLGADVSHVRGFRNSVLAREGIPQIEEYKRYLRLPQKPEPKQFPLGAGITAAVDLIDQAIERIATEERRPVLVGIAGGTASGKTQAVARAIIGKIKEQYGSNAATMLSMDNYYLDVSTVHKKLRHGGKLNFDTPNAVNLVHLASDLDDLIDGREIIGRNHDFPTLRTTWGNPIQPKPVMIVEGVFTLRPPIVPKFDVKIFVDVSAYGQMLRRVMRDMRERGRLPDDTLKYFLLTALPEQKKYVDSTRKNADIVIRNDYNAVREADSIGIFSRQFKFRGIPTPIQLNAIGAVRIGTITQVDRYYATFGEKSGEVLRLRTEGSETLFSYKGPSTSETFRTQPKLEFSIGALDDDLLESFEEVCGRPIGVVRKERIAYSANGVIIYADKGVGTVKDGVLIGMGEFTEVCFEEDAAQRARDTVQSLELSTPIQKPYIVLARELL